MATGILATNHGANDAAAVAGDDNLYVWQKDPSHPSGQTTFVGRLDPGDAGLWNGDALGRMAQTTDDGRYLVFSSYAQLVDSGPTADTDAAEDVYRYDADTGSIVRLSTTTSGDGGNSDGLDATIQPIPYRADVGLSARERIAMSADGSEVVFSTNEALSPDDTNGASDVYEWHDGQVSLVSGGRPSLLNSLVAFITASGNDIYFTSPVSFRPTTETPPSTSTTRGSTAGSPSPRRRPARARPANRLPPPLQG